MNVAQLCTYAQCAISRSHLKRENQMPINQPQNGLEAKIGSVSLKTSKGADTTDGLAPA